MKHYKCNQCQNEFELDLYDDEVCPLCKSTNIKMTKGETTPSGSLFNKIINTIKNNKIISGVVLGFLVLLIILSRCDGTDSYDVSLQLMSDSCKFKVIVKDGEKLVDSKDFRYSCDNGKTWQGNPEFTEEFSGQFYVKVKLKETDNEATFNYQFTNPFNFIPDCSEILSQPCDCKNIQIISVQQKEIGGKLAIIIHSSNKTCGIQYSINGKDGDYTADSIYYPNTTEKELNIFIKTDDCEPVAYNMNPFVVTLAALKCPTIKEMTQIFNQFVNKPETQFMYEIIKKFESPSIKMNIDGGSFYTPPSVDEYFQYLKTTGSSNNVKITVTNIQCNSLRLINSISLKQTTNP